MAEPTTYTTQSMEDRNRLWTWIIPALIIAAALITYAYYYNRNTTATTDQQTTTATPPVTQNRTVQNTQDLGAATAGTKAELSNITINQIVSGRIFTIKSDSQTIYSVLSPNVSLPAKTTLASGQQVAITGTLVSTNTDQFNNLNLTDTEKASLKDQSLVLLVDQVTISGSGATTNPNTNSNGAANNSATPTPSPAATP